MRLRDLGSLTIVSGTGEQPVVGEKAAAMLALLAINANRRVSADALMAAAWGEQPGAGAASTLTSHVWRLRHLLEPDRGRGEPPAVLVNDSAGYRLVCDPATLDSLRFAAAVAEVHDLRAAGRAGPALDRIDAALALWRGTPYGALGETAWARPAVVRLEELRRQLQQHRIRMLLDVGAADAALADLAPLVVADPYSQPLQVLRLQALHDTGRSDLAAEAYRRFRRLLVDDVGVEPDAELQELHRRILRGEPQPAPVAAPTPVAAPARPVEVLLPPVLSPTVGRAELLDDVAAGVGAHPFVSLVGAAGCGKTRVAVDVARRVAAGYPDGVWFVDLTAVGPGRVAEAVLATIGVASPDGASAARTARRYLQQRRLLLVLDNCEHVLDDVAVLVRGALGDPDVRADCHVLLTSREPVGDEGEVVWTVGPLGLAPAGSGPDVVSPAVELFLQRLTSRSPGLRVDREVRDLAARIAVAVDGVPLALELAAARAPSHSLAEIVAQVSADPGGLGRLGRSSSDHRHTVRSTIEWSYRLLDPEERRAHRRLAALPGPFTADAARAVLGHPARDDVDPDAVDPEGDAELDPDVDDVLARLVHRSMLTAQTAQTTQTAQRPGRRTAFRQLATIRSHARRAAGDERTTGAAGDDVGGALDARDRWTADLVAARPPLGTVAEVDWHRRIDDDDAAVRATLERRLVTRPDVVGGRMASALAYYWFYRERLAEAERWLRLAGAALQGRDRTEDLLAGTWLAAVEVTQGNGARARQRIDALPAAVRAVEPDRLVAVGESLTGLAVAAYYREAPALLHEVVGVLTGVSRAAADPHLALLADAVGCCDLLLQGRPAAAVELAEEVQHRADAGGNLLAGYVSTAPPIATALRGGRPDVGLPWIDRCLRLHLRLGTGSAGMFVETKAGFLAQAGEAARAARLYSAAHTATRRAGLHWPNREWTRPLLASTRERLGAAEWARCWAQGQDLRPEDLVEDRPLGDSSGAP